ncbi:MAG: cation transporter [Halobacteriovoraceae bacterium]|nr:cation transporter [Halobacteriovoraceae bacterium]MCB9093805.1 cation transporter [Halobacteriovoraceae bacterium]
MIRIIAVLVTNLFLTFSLLAETKDLKVTYKVNLTCEKCTEMITEASKKHKKIKKLNFDIPGDKVEITFNTPEKLTKKEIRRIELDSGYYLVEDTKEAAKDKKSKK